MYAGSTLKQLRNLDTWFGAHQKIDRLARKKLERMGLSNGDIVFPPISSILRFEGMDGPDAIKRKTPAQDEPWHFWNPYDSKDTQLLKIIEAHHKTLVESLRAHNQTRTSFEAAWIAHAVVDGLTPAHHYPYEQELVRLRGGAAKESRTSPKTKMFMPGDNFTKKIHNNWKMWGDKGLLATHIAFEAGVALLILPLRLDKMEFQNVENTRKRELNYLDYFKSQAKLIARMKLYEQFYTTGWTPNLARQVRRRLVPEIVSTVTFVWQSALQEANSELKK